MLPRAYVVHRIRGRLRLRIHDHREDDDFYERVQDTLEVLPESVENAVTPRTGSILLRHPTLSYDEVKDLLVDNGVFVLEEGKPPPLRALTPLISGASSLDRAINTVTAGTADLRTIMFIVAVGLAIRQLARGEILGPAMPLLLVAMDLAGKFADTLPDRTEPETPQSPADIHPES